MNKKNGFGHPIKESKEYARVDNYEELNRLVYDKYKSIFQYFAKGERKIYLRYKKKVDKYENEKEETEHLCTIDIDELKKNILKSLHTVKFLTRSEL